jgi:hypothetical protein
MKNYLRCHEGIKSIQEAFGLASMVIGILDGTVLRCGIGGVVFQDVVDAAFSRLSMLIDLG